MPTYSRDRLPYNLLKKQYLRPGENAYTYFDNLAAWIRAGSATSNNYSVSTVNGGVVQNEFAPTRFQFPAFYVNEGSAGGGPEFRITHTSNFSDTFGPKNGLVISLWFKLLEFSHDDATNFGSNILCITDGSSSQRIIDVFCTESGDSNPQIGIRIYDASSPSTKFLEILSSQSINASDWNHVLFWIDSDAETAGSVASMSASHAKLYVNGKNTALSSPTYSTASSSTISISHSATSVIIKLGNGGGSSDLVGSAVDTSYMNGYVSDLAIYNSADDLSESLLQILYKLSVQGAYQEQSGFLNNPERIMRNTLDERSYWPSTVKGGDQRRLGNAAIKWDDYKLPEYTTKQVSYPSMLHRNDSLLTSSIYQTYVDGQLNAVTGSRTIPQYSYDMFYEREDEVSLSPFEDSRVYIDRSSDFYLSGSDIPGFTGSLAGKDVVVMEFELGSDKELGGSAYNITTGLSSGSPFRRMGYYNKDLRKIDLLPGTAVLPTSGSAFGSFWQYHNDANQNFIKNELFENAAIGFASIPYAVSSGSNATDYNPFSPEYYSGIGHPIDNFGFPSDSRYEATGSNLIDCSEYISNPFLVEKLTIELPDLSIGADDVGGSVLSRMGHAYGGSQFTAVKKLESGTAVGMMNFFIMKQSTFPHTGSQKSNGLLEGTYNTQNLFTDKNPGANPTFFREIEVEGTTNRFLLANAKIGASEYSSSDSDELEFLQELNIQQYFDHFTIGTPYSTTDSIGQAVNYIDVTDSFIELLPETYSKRDVVQLVDNLESYWDAADYRIESTRKALVLSWNKGARSNTDISSNISISDATPSVSDYKEIYSFTVNNGSNRGALINWPSGSSQPSPFLLFPKDKLILGFQSNSSNNLAENAARSSSKAKIYSGSIKIQLFGSYIQDSKPKLPTLNQTHGYTEAIHGAIGEVSVHDQWDISYRQEFSGSNPDTFMGIATYFPGVSNPDGLDINEGLPERDGITAYHNMTGSEHFGINAMNRARAGLASDGTVGIYDSLKRNYRLEESELYDKDSVTLNVKELWAIDNANLTTSPSAYIGIGDGGADYNPIWPFAFPFEDRYSSVNRIFRRLASSNHGEAAGSIRYSQTIEHNFVMGPTGGFTASTKHGNTANSFFPERENIKSYFLRINSGIIFGIGDGRGGIHIRATSGGNLEYPRGAKYGLSNFYPTSRSAVFRRTSYGQFRDMLEPRLYGPTLDSNLTQIDDPIVSRVLISNGAVEFLDAADSIIGNKDENYRVKTPFFDIPEVPVTISTVNINNIVTTVIDSL
ncbi:hypothetical protein [Limnobacter sp.]|uniref:hypothetical protein n=1 Tax=Limnobacter sp. TaxID=2003368 RepID=UPI00311EF105